MIPDVETHPERIHPTAFIAPGAVLIGNVTVEAQASVWFNVVVRGDLDAVVIGPETNIQDGCILHADRGMSCVLGARVTLGHGAIVHAATIEDDVLVGMRATVLDGACVGRGSVIAAGALIPPGMTIPPQSFVMGIPGKVVRPTDKADKTRIRNAAADYCALARAYREKYPRI